MSIWILIVVFGVIGAGLWFALSRRKKTPNYLLELALTRQLSILTYNGFTPTGVAYRARAPLAIEIQKTIDTAFNGCDLIAAHYDYKNRTGRDNFLLHVLPQEYTSTGGFPSIAVPIRCDALGRDSYCGGEYDKGVFMPDGKIVDRDIHYLLAAERVLADTLDNPKIEFLVIEQQSDAEYLRKSVIYGWEHAALFANDFGKYVATIGAGHDNHPHLPVPGLNE